MKDLSIVILAAGEGTRMKSALPKVLHQIGRRPLIDYVVQAAIGLQPRKIIVVVGKDAGLVKKALPSRVSVVHQKERRGTADAVRSAQHLIGKGPSRVMVLYGDTPLVTPATLEELFETHTRHQASCSVLTVVLDRPQGYGRILRNAAGQCVGIVEDKQADWHQKQIREINSGMYCFESKDLLEALPHLRPHEKDGEYYLTDVISWLFSRQKRVEACLFAQPEEILGVNSRHQLLEAADVLRRRILLKHMEQGVEIQDLHTIFIDETAEIGAGSVIFPMTYIERNARVGKNCQVGPYCHLRENAVLEDDVSIGNFTEVKNSVLGRATFMRHMSYVGDTQVGSRVNIGAGTVVANFDGKKKNKTVIRDGAFIGCDSVLIAPVTVGKSAVVGAGSVVTKGRDVRDRAVVAGVPARELKSPKKKGAR